MTVACGTVWVGVRALDRLRERVRLRERRPTPAVAGAAGEPFPVRVAAPASLAEQIDYRLVMFGALLPDLIDKPLGWVLFRDHFDANGHLYGHTGLFALMLLLPGIYLVARRNDPRLLSIAVAVISHFVVDPVNHSPGTLFWPLLGTDFPEVTFLGDTLTRLSEAAGGLIMAFAAYSLYRRGQLRRFLREGRL